MKLLDKYRATDTKSQYGYDYTLSLYFDEESGLYQMNEEIEHFDKEYPETESVVFCDFESAFKAYADRAITTQYHGGFFAVPQRRSAALKILKDRPLEDDLAPLEISEIISGADEEKTKAKEADVVRAEPSSREAPKCELHHSIQDSLSVLRETTVAALEIAEAEMARLTSELDTLKAAQDDRKSLISQIDGMLHPVVSAPRHVVEEFHLDGDATTVTAYVLATQLGIKPREIYDAVEKGAIQCQPRVPRGKIKFSSEQAQAALSYFGGAEV